MFHQLNRCPSPWQTDEAEAIPTLQAGEAEKMEKEIESKGKISVLWKRFCGIRVGASIVFN